ncbi:MAG: ribonuclease P protein component [Chitinophagaceae bacterium]|nr:ribonuclease P protein component [Chitinophagaceae bacterium]
MKKKLTLGKNERLKSRKVLEMLFRQGRRFSLPHFRVLYLPAEQGLLFGVGVSNKNFKNAVDRNRIKRLIREAFRLQKTDLKKELVIKGRGLNVFIIYTGKELPEYKLVYEKVNDTLIKLAKVIS